MASGILKYDPLEEHLRSLSITTETVTLSFSEIETIIGERLPKSAYIRREWWANQSDVSNRPQAKAWIDAGYKVDSVQQQLDRGTVCFVRDQALTSFSRAD